MENALLNAAYYAVEFIKVWLATSGLLRIKMKKSIYYGFVLSVIGFMVISPWYLIWKSNMTLYMIVIFVIFLLAMQDKRNIGWIILSFFSITLADMLISIPLSALLHYNAEQLLEHPGTVILMNCISLLILLALCLLKRKKQNSQKLVYSDAFILLVCIGALFIIAVPWQLNTLGKQYHLSLLSTILTIGVFIISVFLLYYKKQRELMHLENDMMQKLMKSQEKYYTALLQKEEETKAFRHDVKEHLLCIQTLSSEKKYDELDDYISQLNQNIQEISPRFKTGNAYVNLILNDLSSQFRDVTVDWIGRVPKLSLDTMDLCSLFYNLLKNSFEAADRADDKTVHVNIMLQGCSLMIKVFNGYRDVNYDPWYGYRTTKKEPGHGYGINNIKKCVKKYHGDYSVDVTDEIFSTSIILMNAVLK